MPSKLIYTDLSYKIIGAVFDSYNNLSGDYHEKYYQRAIAQFLDKRKVKYKKEFPVDIKVEGTKIGHHFVDFLVEGKIVLETKRGDKTQLRDIKQVLMYLKTLNLKLGILAYFGANGIKYKRLVNKHFTSD